jgi:hypothetical protein
MVGSSPCYLGQSNHSRLSTVQGREELVKECSGDHVLALIQDQVLLPWKGAHDLISLAHRQFYSTAYADGLVEG